MPRQAIRSALLLVLRCRRVMRCVPRCSVRCRLNPAVAGYVLPGGSGCWRPLGVGDRLGVGDGTRLPSRRPPGRRLPRRSGRSRLPRRPRERWLRQQVHAHPDPAHMRQLPRRATRRASPRAYPASPLDLNARPPRSRLVHAYSDRCSSCLEATATLRRLGASGAAPLIAQTTTLTPGMPGVPVAGGSTSG